MATAAPKAAYFIRSEENGKLLKHAGKDYSTDNIVEAISLVIRRNLGVCDILLNGKSVIQIYPNAMDVPKIHIRDKQFYGLTLPFRCERI